MEYIFYDLNTPNDELLKYNIFISPTASIGKGVKLYSGVKVYGCSEIGTNCELYSNCEICDSNIGANSRVFSSVITSSEIEQGCLIKPFVHIENSKIGEQCVIGTFSCIFNSTIGTRTKISSLSLIRQTEIGNGCTLDSGVCCEPCENESINIGDNVHIMSNSSLINSVVVSDNAEIRPNSVISQNIDANTISTNNIKQITKSK